MPKSFKRFTRPGKPRAAGARGRISNETRSAETRQKLLDAAISSIQERGYHGTTLTAVSKRAGLTRGALQHHFGQRKVNLMTETAEQAYRQLQTRYVSSIEQCKSRSPADAARGLFNDLAELFETPESMALIEIWMASRGDQELAKAVLSTIHGIDREVTKSWNQLFSGLPRGDLYRGIGRSLSSGLPLELLIHRDPALLRRVAIFVGELVARDIEDA